MPYNCTDHKLTPQEYESRHGKVLTDSAGWTARLWNRPSVIMGILCNESRHDDP
ncbi:MAG: hypothetical protein KA354_24100 [Phycisphaerae bacterium]|nr:hypothetical protein [Phycisphaerae bacterium]